MQLERWDRLKIVLNQGQLVLGMMTKDGLLIYLILGSCVVVDIFLEQELEYFLFFIMMVLLGMMKVIVLYYLFKLVLKKKNNEKELLN